MHSAEFFFLSCSPLLTSRSSESPLPRSVIDARFALFLLVEELACGARHTSRSSSPSGSYLGTIEAVTAEQADVSHSDTEQTEAERTERARRQYLSHYERRRALPEVFPSARIMGRGDSPRPWGCHRSTTTLQNNKKSDTPLPEDISNRDLPCMAASQTADVEDRTDGAVAADGAHAVGYEGDKFSFVTYHNV